MIPGASDSTACGVKCLSDGRIASSGGAAGEWDGIPLTSLVWRGAIAGAGGSGAGVGEYGGNGVRRLDAGADH